MQSPLSAAAVAAISVYQRFLSPYKGYCCAHRAHRRGASCSGFAKSAFRDSGFLDAFNAVRARLRECAELAAAGQASAASASTMGRHAPDHDARAASERARISNCTMDGACAACTIPSLFS